MKIYVHNTLTKQVEEFMPESDNIKMYVCGPTVYDRPHIGNARSALVYDLFYRFFREMYGRENVTYVRNITDVDDKIIAKAKENGVKVHDLTREITDLFHDDLNYLGCLLPNFEPKATENIDKMIEIIAHLIQNKHAYVANNHVYFSVETDENYGKLAGRNLDELKAGARIEVEENKHHPADFVLWKPMDSEDTLDSVFDSPWGKGRPGWHIECSAMSSRYLGNNFDFHGGGADLMFPHHTNEIAQSTCAFKGSHYAKYWVHNGFVTVDGEKMSKSLGNFTTVYDMREKGIDGSALRLALLSTHYRKPLDFNEKLLDDSEKALKAFRKNLSHNDHFRDDEILEYLADDLNISMVIARLHELSRDNTDESVAKLNWALDLLGLNYTTKIHTISDLEIESLIHDRQDAKLQKNYAEADKIRQYLLDQGITIEDTKDGTKYYR
ncbi:MAG: cysteine--tRNA ligase [Alphaproteobacteria bacterium]|nr:cysteine--tRNA ligase [Alphaproteobacteria bacterium]OJV15827.1 MAG: cysteine--tRNA ligase [Alphaproteobacteria bacterium 33-17]